MEKPTILLVEDNVSFAQMVKEFLEKHGFVVVVERRGDRAPQRIVAESPSLVLLDIMLPGMDGLSVCRRVRPLFRGPILILTALDEEQDEVTGLETGADDFVVKPIRPHALLARIRNLLARIPKRSTHTERIDLGYMVVDSSSRSVQKDSRTIDLSSAEFDLLWMLAQNAGAIVTREDIYRCLRGIEYDGIDRAMDVRIGRLRRKLGDDARNPQIIKNVRGEGYLLARRA